jgi:hypothetical protein
VPRVLGLGRKFVEIKLAGIDDVSKSKRDGHVVLYGTRGSDAAKRVVGIAVKEKDAQEIMDQARYIGSMPTVEIEDRYWFYVAVLGNAMFEEGKEPSA